MNELGEVFRYAGDAGAIIVLAIVCWGIAGIWGRVAEARIKVDEKRNELDDRQMVTLEKSTALLDRLLTKEDETQTLISAKAQESRLAHGKTRASVERIEQSLQSADEKGDHQHRMITTGIAENGEKLDTVLVKFNEVTKQITAGIVPPEIAKQLSEIKLALDECIRLYRTPQVVPVTPGETSIDNKAAKEA